MTDKPTHTLRLLKQKEVEELYGLPQIQDTERKTVFSLNARELEALSGYHTLSSKLLFILQLGFFRVNRRFYSLEELATAEAEKAYLIERYFPGFWCKNQALLQNSIFIYMLRIKNAISC